MAKQINAAQPATTTGKASHIGEPFAVTGFLNPAKLASISDSGPVVQSPQRSPRPFKGVTVSSGRDQSVQPTERFQLSANNLRKKERLT